MKAAQYSQLGGPEVFNITDVPDPTPKEHEVLIQVAFAGINHTDIHFRRGIPGMKTPLPHIPGSDASGTIVALGNQVKELEIGQRVCINPTVFCYACEFCTRGDLWLCKHQKLIGRESQGAYAELVCVPAQNVYVLPDDFDLQKAAAAPLVYQTAYAMIQKAQIAKGQTVLIMGAGSGVGSAAIQIAKHLGALVISTAGTASKCQKAQERLGIEHVVLYTEEDLGKRIKDITKGKGVDAILDHVGGDTWVTLLKSLKNGGRLITCGATAGFDPKTDLRHIFFRQLQIRGSTMASPQEFEDVMKLVTDKTIDPIIDQVFDLADVTKAHAFIESRAVFGKVLLTIS